MATVLSPTDRRVIITGVSWQTYERLLVDFGDSHAARVASEKGAPGSADDHQVEQHGTAPNSPCATRN
jgi:hypothetical protein